MLQDTNGSGILARQFEQIFEGAGIKNYRSRHAYERAALDAYGRRSVPIAGAPPSRTVAPGKPVAAQHATTAMYQPVHSHLYVDGRKMAENVSHHMVADMEHPNAVGGPDTYGSWQGPATPLNDAA